jgi:hypothetical protein
MNYVVDVLSTNSENIKIEHLSEEENGQLGRGIKRISELIQFAQDKGLKILVDAEYTYMNPGISAVALAMMVAFNKRSAVVGNTYQCYLKVRTHLPKFCKTTISFFYLLIVKTGQLSSFTLKKSCLLTIVITFLFLISIYY